MKHIGILSAFFAAAVTVMAQNSAPPAFSTETNTAPVVPDTNAPADRLMSLQDCIQDALAHNFDVQIQRINPQISQYNLNAAYAGYDVSFNASGQHSYSVSGASFRNGVIYAGTKQNANTFDSGFSGVLPWGLNYNFSGNISDSYGTSGSGSTNFFGLPFENSYGQIGVTLTQPLLKNFWIDSTRLNIKVAKNNLKSSEQGVRQQLITSVTAVANAYYELIFAQENVKVQEEALQLAQTQLDQDRQRLQIGTLAILSVQQDESQVATSKANLIAAQSTLDTDENILKNLLTDNYVKWQGTDIQPSQTLTAPLQTFNLQDSWNNGMTKRPDLLQAKLSVESQGIQLKYSKNQLFPELDLVGSYGWAGQGKEYSDVFGQFDQGNEPFYTYGAKMTVPLGNLNARNQYKAAKANLKQVLLQLKQLEQTVLVQIDNAVKVAQSDYQSVQATKQARIYAEAALEAEQKTYAVGKATTFEVLQYQNSLTSARSQELRALADYNKSLANLAAQEGTTLQQYNINLEVK
ncbi:MAG TPA: TolC family protein [Verrucomicrobiae bacterium]|nr:TolC family protein [Verrucomicrobiae bacterium]